MSIIQDLISRDERIEGLWQRATAHALILARECLRDATSGATTEITCAFPEEIMAALKQFRKDRRKQRWNG